MPKLEEAERDIDAYLAKIRKTIADSEHLVSQAQLRIAETDRMLERQGLTREQVLAMRFTDAQIEAANEELKRRGLSPLERWEGLDEPTVYKPAQLSDTDMRPSPADGAQAAELENRQRKFGMMMKPFQI